MKARSPDDASLALKAEAPSKRLVRCHEAQTVCSNMLRHSASLCRVFFTTEADHACGSAPYQTMHRQPQEHGAYVGSA